MVEDNSLVSIIVPVYNAEKYLSECIESIQNLTYKNIELILIDDGSTDNSGLICDEYATNDHRIRVIHQENSGPSVARNNGINVAKGKYIQFVDSDDSVELNMTNRLVESMNNNVQLAICGYKSMKIDNGNTVIRKHIPFIQGIYQNSEFIKHFGEFYKSGFISALWNKLYVTEVIKKFNMRFIKGLNRGEDLLFNLEYIDVCNSVSIVKDSLYNYLIFNNNNSLTGSFKKDLFENQQMLFQKVRKFLLENNSYKEKNKEFCEIAYMGSIIDCFSELFHEENNLTSNDKKYQINNIILDDCVRGNVTYFKKRDLQTKLIGYLIRNKSINGIYYFLKIKSILRNKMKTIFNLLKRFNNNSTINLH